MAELHRPPLRGETAVGLVGGVATWSDLQTRAGQVIKGAPETGPRAARSGGCARGCGDLLWGHHGAPGMTSGPTGVGPNPARGVAPCTRAPLAQLGRGRGPSCAWRPGLGLKPVDPGHADLGATPRAGSQIGVESKLRSTLTWRGGWSILHSPRQARGWAPLFPLSWGRSPHLDN